MNKILLLIFAILILFIDDNILNIVGYHHNDPHANIIFKIHPLAYISVVSLFCYIISFKIKVTSIVQNCKVELSAIIFSILLLMYLIVFNRLAGISFLIDAIVTPALVSILLFHTPQTYLIRNSKIIYAAFFINFGLALVEKLLHRAILSQEFLYFEEFRSTALYGHPLNNALIMSAIGILLYIYNDKLYIKLLLLLCTVVAVLCFGARGASIGIIGGVGLSFIIDSFSKKFSYTMKSVLGLFLIFCVGYAIVINTSLGDRILKRSSFKDDKSAQERVKTLSMLDKMTDSQLQWGMTEVETTALMNKTGTRTMENYFVVWVTKFGVYFSIILFIVLLIFMAKQIRHFNKAALLPALFTILFVASINNSLATNTRLLCVLSLCCYSLIKRKEVYVLRADHSIN
ncbi:hypothetical protein FPZ43_14095 [Mucilaginibacter pallidiroseus]|uniref:Uncharacterized protein n=1 Tax=Mucilaginibacter pallidiroseus TaxID=2599295 RepID=A0A563U8E5_9SPHI|nr:VpsF family polysaccharide biosynthesis protein [Mucilaginibacter pallidiroseus]TWR27596.1 hypothetical protein FPZ43_14095 [Mucilaginibacter pallidiroseus]